jgi:hypothetical protein
VDTWFRVTTAIVLRPRSHPTAITSYEDSVVPPHPDRRLLPICALNRPQPPDDPLDRRAQFFAATADEPYVVLDDLNDGAHQPGGRHHPDYEFDHAGMILFQVGLAF